MLAEDFHFSPKYHYIYVATRKVACSTIKYTLQTAESGVGEGPNEHSSQNPYGYSDFLLDIHDARRWQLAHPNNTDDIESMVEQSNVTFCFVRNPYTRVLSAYLDKIHLNENRRKTFLASFFDEERAAKPVSFVEFLKLVAGQEVDAMDGHWRPQYHHLKSFGIKYDMVGSFETLDHDLEVVIRDIDEAILAYKKDIVEHHTGSSQKTDVYNDEAVELVQRIYQDDFDKLGYSMRLSDVSEPSTLSLQAGIKFCLG